MRHFNKNLNWEKLVDTRPGLFSTPGSARAIIREAGRKAHSRNRKTFNVGGGWGLIEEAVEGLFDQTLHHNWGWWFTAELPQLRGKWVKDDPDRNMLSSVARIAGWLSAAKSFPRVRKLLQGCNRGNGVGSSHSRGNPIQLAGRWTSPGQLENWIRKVRVRAAKILAAYNCVPSWDAVWQVAVEGYSRPHRAAVRVAAQTIRGRLRWCDHTYLALSYRQSMLVLIKARGIGPVWDRLETARELLPMEEKYEMAKLVAKATSIEKIEIGGRKVFIDLSTRRSRFGIEIFDAISFARTEGFVVRAGNKVDFFDAWGYGSRRWPETKISPEKALRKAISLWRERARMAKAEAAEKQRQAMFARACQEGGTERISFLVTWGDARSLGLCASGTRDWLEGKGIPLRHHYRFDDLKHLAQEEPRVLRVLEEAAKRSLREIGEI